MRKIGILINVGIISICSGCSIMLNPPQDEYIHLVSFDLNMDVQQNQIIYECPSHEWMRFLFKINTAEADVDAEHIISIWESNYSATIRFIDAGGSLVYSNKYDSLNKNIITGGNWLEPAVTIILGGGNDWAFLDEGHIYIIEISLTGKGLEEHSLDFINRRIF
jgi:hypothetical protein